MVVGHAERHSLSRWQRAGAAVPSLFSDVHARGAVDEALVLSRAHAPKTGLMTVLRAEKWKWYGGGPRCTLQMKRENASESWRPVGDLDAGCK